MKNEQQNDSGAFEFEREDIENDDEESVEMYMEKKQYCSICEKQLFAHDSVVSCKPGTHVYHADCYEKKK